MDEFLEQINEFEVICNNSIGGLDSIKEKIIEIIIIYTEMFYETDDINKKNFVRNSLIDSYNKLFICNSKKDVHRMYMLDEEIKNLPNVYLIDDKPVRFDIDYDTLNNIDISSGLTEQQAQELLKWTSNNTRDNLNNVVKKDVYDNENLIGTCGFAQYSSLYPLQKLGLKITVNNIGNIGNNRHAYGTVTMPIKTNNGIVNRKYLIDCTYRQFFTIEQNVITRYISDRPSAGFFVMKDPKKIKFAQELLKNGFTEATTDNLESYLKPFFCGRIPISKIDTIDEKFNNINIDDLIDNNQSKFEYTEEEFIGWGCNLEIPTNNLKR